MAICGFESLSCAVIQEILLKLDLESLCAAAPTCRLLYSCVSQVLPLLETVNVSELSPDKKVLNYLLCCNRSVRNLTINCSLLDDSSIDIFTLSHLHELVLLKCYSFSHRLLAALGRCCTNLRVLSLELTYHGEIETPEKYKLSLIKLLEGCPSLESLSIKFEGTRFDHSIFEVMALFLPVTVKILHLQYMTEKCMKQLAHKWVVHRIVATPAQNGEIPISLGVSFRNIQSLSLVLDRITDALLTSITQNLVFLAKLELQDEPMEEALVRNDLTNGGVQSLGSCNQLSHLSLIRSRGNYPAFFRRVNDMGMFLMSEGCKNMESIKLGGFYRVTDAGFSAIIHTCKKLKNFELYNTFHLSDLAFHDLLATSLSLVSVRLISCNLITSESVEHIAFCENLELLDLKGCKSVADNGMRAISGLKKLNTLSLSGADITDIGLSILGGGITPLESLSLRGCKRVTDHGVALLLGGCIKKTLTSLDLGYMPAISDKAVKTLMDVGLEIVELCIRNCFYVTDASIAALACKAHGRVVGGSLRRLDLYNCIGLSSISLQWLRKPYFPRLRWLGLGSTALSTVLSSRKLEELSEERPSLSICWSGCEVGCHDRWQFHEHL
eukprot:Gb_15427 [translate_table: standard]